MAKNVEETKKNKVLEILSKEYPFERLLLGILGIVVLVLGVYLVEGTVLSIRYTDFWLFNTPLKITIFSIFVIIVGAVSFLLSVWAFFQPSLSEMKKVSWPDSPTILNHSARVFGFIIVLSLFFVFADVGLIPLFDWLNALGV